MLDTALAVGAVPQRFGDLDPAALDTLFTLARGSEEQPPLEMTKWFDSNYHYLVPELGAGTRFRAVPDRLVALLREAAGEGVRTRPVLVGPVTLLALSKDPAGSTRPLDRLDDLLPVYAELLRTLRAAGAEWVQLDEPALVAQTLGAASAELATAAARAYAVLGAEADRPSILVAATWGALGEDALAALAASPVEAVAIDLVRGAVPSRLPADVRAGLARKTLVAGVVDGRNIWRTDLAAALDRLDAAASLGARLAVSTATSLLHVPHDVDDEPDLPVALRGRLAFADQKVREVVLLATAVQRGRAAIADAVEQSDRARAAWGSTPGVRVPEVRARVAAVTVADRTRVAYADRVAAQQGLHLPPLPTTTIGSFPQTADVRRLRSRLAQGDLTPGRVRRGRARRDRAGGRVAGGDGPRRAGAR